MRNVYIEWLKICQGSLIRNTYRGRLRIVARGSWIRGTSRERLKIDER